MALTDGTLGPFIPCIGDHDTYANLAAAIPATTIQKGVCAFCPDVGWVWSDGANWRRMDNGGTNSTQFLTSGGSATVGAGVHLVILDGVATTFALTFRAPRYDQDTISVQSATAVSVGFSIPITAPATVIKSVPSTTAAATGLSYVYRASNTTWYRLY